jgi:hypothetical protein
VIDKLDVSIPGATKFSREFRRIYADADRPFAEDTVWRKNKYFQQSGDFTAYGIPAVVHLGCKMTKDKHHKIEILKAGERTMKEMVAIISQVFDGDPEAMRLARIDLTADVKDVPVQWFKEHTYCVAKQTTREIGTIKPIPYMAVRKGSAETIYAGVKPNQIRIYDKTRERMMQLDREHRRIAGRVRFDAQENCKVFVMPQFITFEELYGYSPDKVITRVERQVANRDLEKIGLTHVHKLKTADILEPFNKVKFFAEESPDLSIETWGFTDYLAGLQLQQMQRDFGINEVRKRMQEHIPGRNWKRVWDKFQPWLTAQKDVGITSANLTAEYQNSTYRQMCA